MRPLITALGLKNRFPKEYETWDRKKNEIERRFQRIVSQQQAEMHAKFDEDPEDIRPKVRRGVVSELIEAFP
jgi:hypothetical protein